MAIHRLSIYNQEINKQFMCRFLSCFEIFPFYGCLHNFIYASTKYLKMNFVDVYKKKLF